LEDQRKIAPRRHQKHEEKQGDNMNTWKISGFLTILMMLLLAACSILQPSPTPLAMDTKVDVGGRGLYIFCDGQGSPTVVFEGGRGGDSSYWLPVFQETIKYTSACIYDRANLGRSDPAPNPRSTQDYVDDLHNLLANAQIPGPYLLVGHSMGGMTVLLYAAQYPKEVGGIVLVDPTHPDQYGDRYAAIMPTESAGEAACLKEERKPREVKVMSGPESWDFEKSVDQVRAIQSLGDLPFTVISRGVTEIPWCPPAADAGMQLVWDLHKEYSMLSSDSKQVIAENSGHLVMMDRPDTIVQAIRERVDELRYAKNNEKQPEMTPNPTLAPNQTPYGSHDGEIGQMPMILCKAWGWAIDPDNPEMDVTVRVLSDGKEVASQVADKSRVDVDYCSDGTCGFDINLADLISPSQEHSILLQAQDIQTGAWITLDTPKIINCK
jgi:pimeloyl-ACP methyl ester carboxylesterase